MIKLTNKQPTKPGTYFLRANLSTDQFPDKLQNTRLADLCLVAGYLMVYCLDIDIHRWLEHCPTTWLWSEEPIEIEGDNRLN